ncbi:MAG: hypothetical protein OXC62_02450 [Aestuariivita sp.]|nr:hypothetical protein [Aestuariivita sp.]
MHFIVTPFNTIFTFPDGMDVSGVEAYAGDVFGVCQLFGVFAGIIV